MIIKLLHAIKFFLVFYIIKPKSKLLAEHIIVVDGPTSIEVSKKLFDLNDRINFFIPLHYIPLIKNTNIADRAIMPPLHAAIILAFQSFFLSCKKKTEPFTTILSSKLICYYIRKNHLHVKGLTTFNERNLVPYSAICCARSVFAKTSCIQHGAIVEKYFPIYVDTYFTWSDYFSELIHQRYPKVKTMNVGKLGYSPPLMNSSTHSSLPLIILQPGDISISYELLFHDFVNIIKTCLETHDGVILRPHPNDNILEKLLRHFQFDPRINIDKLDLRYSLSKAKFVISLYSTVLIEASLSGCISIQYINHAWYKPIFKRSHIMVSSSDSLSHILISPNLNMEEQQEKFLSKPNYNLFFETLNIQQTTESNQTDLHQEF